MRAAARFLGRAVLALGWFALALIVGSLLAEKTGLAAFWAEHEIARRLGSSVADLEIDHLELGWFDGRVLVRGLALGPGGDALRVEEASLGLDFTGLLSGRRPRVADVDVRGGHVRFSRELMARVRGITADLPEPRPGAARTWEVPAITVRDVEVDLDTEGFGRLPIGRVDAAVRSSPGGPPFLVGRIVPSLSAGPGDPGEVFLSGQEYEPGAFDVHASAVGVPISTALLPAGTDLEGIRQFAPRATLALKAETSFRLDGRSPPHAAVRLTLSNGEVALADGSQRVLGARVDLDASYEPADSGETWSLLAWTAALRGTGEWQGVPFEASARLGDSSDGAPLLSGRLHVPRLPANEELLELFGRPRAEARLWQALDPRGEVELWCGVECSRGWEPGRPLADALSAAFEVAVPGTAGVTYRGYESASTGRRDQGFPLPVDAIHGRVVGSVDWSRTRPILVGIVDATGEPASGKVRLTGLVTSHPKDASPDLPGHGFAELDLHFEASDVPADDRLHTALAGLTGVLPPDSTWKPMNPSGGSIAARVRLVREVDMPYAATHVDLDVRDLSLAWQEVPVPVTGATGRFEFVSDGASERGLAASFRGSLHTAAGFAADARYQTDPSAPAPPEGKSRIDAMSFLSLRATRMSLSGDDKKVLASRFGWLGAAMDPFAPKGFVDVTYQRSHPAASAVARTRTEVTPREAEVTPEAFPVPVASVLGRVIVTVDEDPAAEDLRTQTRLAPLAGTLSGDVHVALEASFPGGRLTLHGAGIDPGNKAVLGALGQALRGSSGREVPDLTSLSVEGPLDVIGELDVGEKPDRRQSFRAFLRENSLQTQGTFRLDRLQGILDVDVKDGVLHGNRIEASLAGTPLQLAELRIAATPQGYELTTRIPRVENLPLDRDHLRPFVDEKTLAALLGPLGWRGRIDLEDGRVRILGAGQGDARLEFSGKLTPSDMQLNLGLPLGIRSATATVERLVFDGGRVRAVLRIEDLYGTIAGRDLARASVLLTYFEPRLSIETLTGRFEGGDIRPLGEGAERAGTAFSIDLEEPFPFQLAIDLRDVELAGLFRGLFATDFATRGKLDCQIRLTGDTQKILAIQGSGSVQVKDSLLWSVPVFRALFSQLGLDDEIAFKSMGANLRVRDGVIWTDDITIRSPIIQLVGKGWVDFDGAVKEDLQVRYGLIDRLGPITRLIYAIQKQLLSVSIRGDLARPIVIFKYPWRRVRSDPNHYRSLPLPPFTPLPQRF